MTEWQEFDPSVILPDGIEDMMNAADSVIAALNTGLEAVQTALDTAILFATEFDDAYTALIEAMYTAIDAVIQNLTQTGVYATFHGPIAPLQTLSPSMWVSDLAASFADWFDPRRPILPTSQFVGGLAIIGVADTHDGLMDLYRKMFEMFGRFIASVDQLGRWPQRSDPWVVLEGIGRAPNWRSVKSSDIVPAMGEIADILVAFKDMLEPTLSMKGIYQDFSDLLQGKMDQLSTWSSRILAILEVIDTILGWEGSYYLPISGEFDQASLQQELYQSTGGPMDIENANYTSGMMFLGIGGTGQALLDMFRIPWED